MAKFLAKVAKWGLTLGGAALSVLSLGSLAAVGVPLMVAGQAIDTGASGTSDTVSAYGANLATTVNKVAAMQASQAQPNVTIGTNQFIEFVKQNLLYILLGIAAIFILPKLIGGRR